MELTDSVCLWDNFGKHFGGLYARHFCFFSRGLNKFLYEESGQLKRMPPNRRVIPWSLGLTAVALSSFFLVQIKMADERRIP